MNVKCFSLASIVILLCGVQGELSLLPGDGSVAPTEGNQTGNSTVNPPTSPKESTAVTKSMVITTTPHHGSTPKPSGPPTYELKANKTTCMLLQASIIVYFKYDVNETMNSTVPRNAAVSGTCGDNSDVMKINWNETGSDMLLTLKVMKDKSSYKLSSVILNSTTSGEKMNFSSKSLSAFETSVGMYYKCLKANQVKVGNMNLTLNQLKLQAFRTGTDATFNGDSTDCDSKSKTDTIVPIAVGCALAAMVLIVLVGYCIGRRRTRAGYQAMNA